MLCLCFLALAPSALAAPGELDLSFDPGTGPNGNVRAIAVQSDGKILIRGDFTTVNQVSRNGLARLNSDGSLDTTFAPARPLPGDTVSDIDARPDGSIFVSGRFFVWDGVSPWPTLGGGIVELHPDGSLDSNFIADSIPGFVTAVHDFVVQFDGKIVLTDGASMARLNTDGSLDASFAVYMPGSEEVLEGLGLQSTGKVLYKLNLNNVYRLNPDGSADGGSLGIGIPYKVQPDDKLLTAGGWGMRRVNPNGMSVDGLDATFDGGYVMQYSRPSMIELQRDGKVLVAGIIQTPDGQRSLIRLDVNGTLDPAFSRNLQLVEGIEGVVGCVAVQPDGKILIGGSFTAIDGVPRVGIARLDGDPTIQSLVPNAATAGTGDVPVALLGAGFDPAADTVLFGNPGSQTELIPNPATATTTRLDVVIPGSLLANAGDFTTYPIMVRGPGGELTLPAAFTVLASGIASKVDEVQTGVVTSGETATVAIPPSTEGDGGISATLTATGEEPATLTVATYTSDPSESGNSSFEVAGQFLDLNASGVTEADSMRVYFYFPAGTPTETLSLKFWNTRVTPAAWEDVTPTTIDTVLHRIEVVFDASSHPKITELDGTFFAPTVTPPIQFTGFLSPLGGADATGGSFTSPLRTFKAGSTIPVKFSATLAGAPVTTGVHSLRAVKYSDDTTVGTPIDATPQDAATAGNQFRFADGNWQFNLDTKSTGITKGVWQLTATLSDGSQHTGWIQIK